MSIQEANLKAIADAIREKEGSAEPIPAGDFAERIRAMRIGGDVTLASIAITAPPNQVSYKTGSLFDPTGMSVWAEFSNGYGLYVNHADLVFDPAGPLEAGTESVTVRFSWGGETAETTQAVSVKNVNIYGVEWDGGPSTKLSRTDDAAGFVDPVAAVGDGSGSSPFDDIYPWSGMVRVTQDGNELVAIPKYWVKVQHDPFRVQIVDMPVAGYQVSPAHRDRGDGQGERDVVYIGRYECDNEFRSRSAATAKYMTANTREWMDGIHALGDEYWIADYPLRLTWLFLYLVEFANWDGQEVIGNGIVNASYASRTGMSDSMAYHTGCVADPGQDNAIQYRGIENPWGNLSEYLGGIVFSGENVCTYNNPANFSGNYNGTGAVVRDIKRPTDLSSFGSFYIKAWGSDVSDPSFVLPAKVGTGKPPIPDFYIYRPDRTGLCAGGGYNKGVGAGPFFFDGGNNLNGFNIGARLMKLPNPTEEEAT